MISRHVRRGEPLRIQASTFNAMIDAARAQQRGARQASAFTRPFGYSGDVILVKNISGSDCAQGNILCVTGPLTGDNPLLDPAEEEQEFKSTLILACTEPEYEDLDRIPPFVILAEAIKNGKIGWAYASGVCITKVRVPDEDSEPLRYAELVEWQVGYLDLVQHGCVEVLWRAGGASSWPSTEWAIVRFPRNDVCNNLFAVRVWVDGGTTDGDGANQCDRTYSVYTIPYSPGTPTRGVLLGEDMTPLKPRPTYGTLNVADTYPSGSGRIGLGFWQSTYQGAPTFKLYDAGEVELVEQVT